MSVLLRAARGVLAATLAGSCAGCASVRGASTLLGGLPRPAARPTASVAPGSEGENEPQIQPDRPDLTNAAYTVPPALAQLEIGGLRTRVRDSGQTVGTPASLRIGLSDCSEARIETGGFARDRQGTSTSSGFGGLSLGAKLRVWAPRGGAPAIAVLPSVTVPWRRLDNSGTDYRVTVITGADLTDTLHLDVNYAVGAIASPGSHFAQHQASASTSVSIGNWAPYVEAYWLSKSGPDTGGAASLDAGVVVALRQRLALDGGATFGLTRLADGPAVFAGLSVILGEIAGHKGVDSRLREAQRRGDR